MMVGTLPRVEEEIRKEMENATKASVEVLECDYPAANDAPQNEGNEGAKICCFVDYADEPSCC